MTNEQKPAISLADAKGILTALANVQAIQEVYVVGSIAREGKGHDLDVVLVVDHYTYIAFLLAMKDELNRDYDATLDEQDNYYYGYRRQRMEAAFAVIDMHPAEYAWVMFALQELPVDVDIHPMPMDWRENIDKVQTHLPHKDPRFVCNIAGDAQLMYVGWGPRGSKIPQYVGRSWIA